MSKTNKVYENFLYFIISLLLFASGCKKDAPSNPGSTWQWPVMGTVATLTIHGEEPDVALVIAKSAIEEVNAQLSAFNASSDVGQINAAAGTEVFVPLRSQTQRVFDASFEYGYDSGNAFSPLVGPLMEMWGFSRGAEGKRVGIPSARATEAARALCDLRRVERRADGAVRLLDDGMKLDFGAIAKGHAVDVAFERLLAAGYTNVLVNLGGNMRASGQPSPMRKTWHIAVRDPRKAMSEPPLGVVLLGEGRAIATSGSYEQYFEWEGKRYSHIMDPRTGSPVSGLLQVTIVAPTAMAADALSTTCFVLGIEAGMNYLVQHQGCDALFVVDDETGGALIKMTGGFKDVFEAGRIEADER